MRTSRQQPGPRSWLATQVAWRCAISKILTLLAVGCPLVVMGCAARVRVHDYVFGVTGVVTTEDGVPPQDAEVTLEVNGPVYEAVTLVRTEKRSTNDTGGFVFGYISHEFGVKYSLTVRKESGGTPYDSHEESWGLTAIE